MGERGRLVLPAELRAASGLIEGSPLVLVGTRRIRSQLAGASLVDSLLAERRRAAAAEDDG